jgi:hypothetical protein
MLGGTTSLEFVLGNCNIRIFPQSNYELLLYSFVALSGLFNLSSASAGCVAPITGSPEVISQSRVNPDLLVLSEEQCQLLVKRKLTLIVNGATHVSESTSVGWALVRLARGQEHYE